MSDYRTKDRTILGKVETTSGTDASPTVSADAFLCMNPQWTGGLETLERNEVSGSLSSQADVPGGGAASWSAGVNMKGSGAGGTAPEWGPLMQGCALAETTTAADDTGTAQAGAASTITLAAGASAVNDFYKGMVIETTGGTGSGQKRVVASYVGSTKVATVYPAWTTEPDLTTAYAIRANQLYIPATTGLKTLTIYDYQHSRVSGNNSRLFKLLGGAGNASFTLPNRGLATAQFEYQGKFVTPTDVAKPGAATFDAPAPEAVMGATVYLNSVVTRFNELTFDLGNEIGIAPDPGDIYGVNIAGVVSRKVTGRVNPPLSLLSVRDVWTDFLAGTQRQLWVDYGSALGKSISFYFPQLVYTGSENEDLDGFVHEGIPFAAQGEDTEVYVCIY